jgi:hypothetical protein
MFPPPTLWCSVALRAKSTVTFNLSNKIQWASRSSKVLLG